MNTVLKNRQIVCLALASWGGEYLKATIALVKPLSQLNTVLYVDYPRTWMDIIRGVVGKRNVPFARVFGWQDRLSQPEADAHPSLWLLTLPPVLPIRFLPRGRFYETGKRLNAWIVARSVKKAMRRLDIVRPIVINGFQPGLGSAIRGKLNEELTVYHCYDQIAAAAWCKTHGPEDEKQYLTQADLVITTSDALWEEKERLANQCYLVRNGVDFDLFDTVKKKRNSPGQAAPYKAVAGFIGVMDDRIDIPLMVELAGANPDLRIDLVGPVVNKAVSEALMPFENVRFLGSATQSELPGFMSQFDVGIIPFGRTLFTKFVYPIKVNEYLAAGLPVVMTPFANLPSLDKAVAYADSAEAFGAAIHQEIGKDSPVLRQQRKAFAAQNSWTARSLHLSRIIASNLHTRAAA